MSGRLRLRPRSQLTPARPRSDAGSPRDNGSSTTLPTNANLPAPPVEAADAAAQAAAKDPATQTINMRCLIVTQDASIIIGKAGRHVNEIRVGVAKASTGRPD